MFDHVKILKNFLFFILFIILIGCQFQEPLKTHGIIYLENRSQKVIVNKSNKNDIIRIFGQPQATSQNEEDTWIYFERILTKGKYHKLGRHVVKENNVLVCVVVFVQEKKKKRWDVSIIKS